MVSKEALDDDVLTRYLLGTLPEEDADRVDEWSIADDEVAWRLRAVENDLVDAYARGEMQHGMLESFKNAYLSTPERRNKVIVAKGLISVRNAKPVAAFTPRRRALVWAVAACLAIMVAAAVFMVFSARRENAVRPVEVVAKQRPVTRPVAAPVAVVSFVLAAPSRGPSSLTTLTIPAGTTNVVLHARIDSNDFASYEAVLRDLTTAKVVWRSRSVRAENGAVPFAVPRSVLADHDYSLELSGATPGKPSEPIGSYTFRVREQ